MAPDSPGFPRGIVTGAHRQKKPPTVSQGFRRRQRFPAVRISNRSESGNREQRQGAADDIRLRPFSRPAPPRTTTDRIFHPAPSRYQAAPPPAVPGLRTSGSTHSTVNPASAYRPESAASSPPASPKRARGGAPILSTGIGPYPSNLPTSATGADRTSAPRRTISSNRAAEPNEIRAPPKRGKRQPASAPFQPSERQTQVRTPPRREMEERASTDVVIPEPNPIAPSPQTGHPPGNTIRFPPPPHRTKQEGAASPLLVVRHILRMQAPGYSKSASTSVCRSPLSVRTVTVKR